MKPVVFESALVSSNGSCPVVFLCTSGLDMAPSTAPDCGVGSIPPGTHPDPNHLSSWELWVTPKSEDPVEHPGLPRTSQKLTTYRGRWIRRCGCTRPVGRTSEHDMHMRPSAVGLSHVAMPRYLGFCRPKIYCITCVT